MNTIIVMLDTLRPDHLGCYGNNWIKTPNFNAFARESMVFDRAVPESLPTLQVRRALMTGMRVFPFTKDFYSPLRKAAETSGSPFSAVPGTLIPGWEPIPWDLATLAEMLQGLAGIQHAQVHRHDIAYRTALITDTSPYFFTPGMNFHRGFAHWEYIRGQLSDAYGIPMKAKKWDISRFVPDWMMDGYEATEVERYLANTADWQFEEDRFSPRVFNAAMQWLEGSREAEDPFFLLVDSFDPHEPWDPPQHYVDLYDPGYEGVELIHPYYGPTDQVSEAELKHMRALYAAEVTMVDAWFGKFVDKVRDLNLLDNTLIVVTSDHGHQLGEHGLCGKVPFLLDRQLLDCVLIIRHPQGIGAGHRSDALVQHQDICATVLNNVGINPPYELDGEDLMPIMEGKTHKVRDYATCGYASNVWAFDGQYVLMCSRRGNSPKLYDMTNDPEQLHDIASDNPKAVQRLFDLVIQDAGGGPIAPGWEMDLSLPGLHEDDKQTWAESCQVGAISSMERTAESES